MSVLKFIFSKIGAIFKFVNEYFKSFVFLLIVILIIVNSGKSEIANLTEISFINLTKYLAFIDYSTF